MESGHFYVATRDLILGRKLLQSGVKSEVVQVPECISLELDEPWQIPFVELMLKLYYGADL